MKKTFSIIFANLFLLAPLTFAFTDVSSSHVYHEAITFLESQGILNGNPDGSYKPDEQINRAAFIKIIVEERYTDEQITTALDQYKAEGRQTVDYSDVPITEWYAPYVRLGTMGGTIRGYGDGSFRPGDNVNFVEAMKMVNYAYGIAYDENANPWYRDIVDQASQKNIIPLDITSFDQKITRAQMADMITRATKMQIEELRDYLKGAYDTVQTYQDIENGNNQIAAFINREENYEQEARITDKIAVVFAYIDEPMPDELKEKIISKDWYKKSEFKNEFTNCTETNDCFIGNLHFIKDWGKREAEKYEKKFIYDFKFISGDYEIKEGEYTNTEQNIKLDDPEAFYKRVFSQIEDLDNYQTISFITYVPYFAAASNHASFISTDRYDWWTKKTSKIFNNFIMNFENKGEYYPFREQDQQRFITSWTHEFFHTLGAIDKYGTTIERACRINPETDEEYDNYDLFCRRIPMEDVKGYDLIEAFADVVITEPTAEEIGWK